jgi:hypothetical protein
MASRKQTKNKQSFFKKYWIFILLALAFLMKPLYNSLTNWSAQNAIKNLDLVDNAVNNPLCLQDQQNKWLLDNPEPKKQVCTYVNNPFGNSEFCFPNPNYKSWKTKRDTAFQVFSTICPS